MAPEEQCAVTQEFMLEPESNFGSDPGALMALDVAATTHEGHVRPNNEDHYLVIRFGRSLRTLHTNVEEKLAPANYDLTGYGMLGGGRTGWNVGRGSGQQNRADKTDRVSDGHSGLDSWIR